MQDLTTVECVDEWGDPVRVAICRGNYEAGDGLALLALDVTDPDDEDAYLDVWACLTVNLPCDPVAAAWCSEPGHVVVDANDVPAALLDALVGAGVIRLSGRSVRSGYCSYPLATVPPCALAGIRGYEETVRELDTGQVQA